MTIRLPSTGFTPNCTFDPPVSTPISRMIAAAASRISWYSRSVRVCAGATVMESPVCTPMASKFSMLQTTTTLSAWSRIISSSYSFQPSTLCSIKHSWVGDWSSAHWTWRSNSDSSKQTLPPVPPMVKLGRRIAGIPVSATISRASSTELATPDSGTLSEMFAMAWRNSSRSSAFWMASRLAPIRLTPCFSRTPASLSAIVKFRAVCPPMVGRSTSGFSIARILSTASTVIGSIYVRSATSGSVMMVAGFEFKRTTR